MVDMAGDFCEARPRPGNWPGRRGEHRIVRVRARVGNLRFEEAALYHTQWHHVSGGLPMEAIVESCAGLDVHQATVVACVLKAPLDARPRPRQPLPHQPAGQRGGGAECAPTRALAARGGRRLQAAGADPSRAAAGAGRICAQMAVERPNGPTEHDSRPFAVKRHSPAGISAERFTRSACRRSTVSPPDREARLRQ